MERHLSTGATTIAALMAANRSAAPGRPASSHGQPVMKHHLDLDEWSLGRIETLKLVQPRPDRCRR